MVVPEVPEVPGFELGELLARGATSEVWAAVALDDGHRVAVKVVHADLAALEAAAREAAVSARAASAHVVEVQGCVELADGRVALVLPHLRGGPLDALVRARGHLSPGEVVTVLAPMASALGRLHDLGVVHGDVSPGNVLLDLDGRPVLGDLGLGHVVGEVSPGVWGTDGYVAPEVLLGADPTPASDVYALGALGWLCLSGTVPGPPGLRPELGEVCRAGAGSEALVAAVGLAVSADPADRPGAHELAWLLFGAAEAEPLHLVHGDDAVSSVTYRLRAAAGVAATVEPPHGWWSRVRWCGSWVLRRPVRPSAPARPEPRGRPGREGRQRRQGRHVRPAEQHGVLQAVASGSARAAAPVLLGLCIAALLVLTVALLGREGGAAQARSTGTATSNPAASTTAASSTVGPRTDLRTDATAPRTRPAELLQVLADERAAAWRDADPTRLAAADAPGSPAAARDAAALAELVRAEVRYNGLRHTVVDATIVSASQRRAVVRARIDAEAYTVVGRTTSEAVLESRPAVVGVPVLVHLVLTEVGWRIDDVGAAP